MLLAVMSLMTFPLNTTKALSETQSLCGVQLP